MSGNDTTPITEQQYDRALRHLQRSPAFLALPKHEQAVKVAERALRDRDVPRPHSVRRGSPYCCDLAKRMAEDFDLGATSVARLREEHPHTPEAIDIADAARRKRTP